MTDPHSRIFADAEFQALQKTRSRFTWSLAATVLGSFVAFILTIAFYPQLLAQPISADSVISWGIPVAVGIIVCGFALTGLYAWRANGEFDSRIEAIIKRLESSE